MLTEESTNIHVHGIDVYWRLDRQWYRENKTLNKNKSKPTIRMYSSDYITSQ